VSLIKISFSRLFIGAATTFLAFVLLAVMVNQFGMFQPFNDAILQNLFLFQKTGLTNTFLLLTFFGSTKFVLSITAITGVIFFYKKEFSYFLLFLGTVTAASLSLYFLKLFFHHPRPMLFPPLVHETSFSFPSGHATLSVLFFGLLAYLAASSTKKTVARSVIFFLWIFIILGIGISRIYLGAHSPTDVFAGWLLGMFFLCFGIELFERFAQNNRLPQV
jgi:undecaprenyl-diphosphatase